MTFSLSLLCPARKELDKLDNKRAKSILDHLEEPRVDPFRPRPGMNIDKVERDRKPPAYRLRVGRLRIEYLVVDEEDKIVVFNIFMKKRSSDYR
jgi:mRNA-degrading endonuclease RelE of RelBE toxin-antitoxin system